MIAALLGLMADVCRAVARALERVAADRPALTVLPHHEREGA